MNLLFVVELLRRSRLGDQFQVVDLRSDPYLALAGKYHACERLAFPLASSGLYQEVHVGGEEYPPKSQGPIQERDVAQPVGAVLVGGQDVHAPEPQAVDHCTVHVVVEVEGDGHSSLPGRS
jgi:hypothetical protein